MQEIGRDLLKDILENDMPDIKGKELWIWGTGVMAQLFVNGLDRLDQKEFRIAGWCDSKREKWNTDFCGKKIISPSSLKTKRDVCVLICSAQTKVISEIKKALNEMRLKYYLLSEVLLKTHEKEILQCYDMLETRSSKNIYANIISCRIKGDYSELQDGYEEDAYFPREILQFSMKMRCFVDCGAFVGDTIEKYIWKIGGGYI